MAGRCSNTEVTEMRALLKAAVKIRQLHQTLLNISEDDGKEIEDYTDSEIVNEAKYVLSTYFERGHINNDELNEHYVDQMYTSRQFAPDEMKAWEENDEDDKNDWEFVVQYFSAKMVAINKYLQNNGDDAKYDSAANVTQEKELANAGDEIRKYILTLTQANE